MQSIHHFRALGDNYARRGLTIDSACNTIVDPYCQGTDAGLGWRVMLPAGLAWGDGSGCIGLASVIFLNRAFRMASAHDGRGSESIVEIPVRILADHC